jgi:hypothetical protein
MQSYIASIVWSLNAPPPPPPTDEILKKARVIEIAKTFQSNKAAGYDKILMSTIKHL